MIREYDANKTSGEIGLALSGNLVGESQLRIPKLQPDTMLSNIVRLESVRAVQRSYFSYFFFKNPSLSYFSYFFVLVSRVLFQNSVNYC